MCKNPKVKQEAYQSLRPRREIYDANGGFEGGHRSENGTGAGRGSIQILGSPVLGYDLDRNGVFCLDDVKLRSKLDDGRPVVAQESHDL